jgi:hypothetical protein
MMTAVLVVGFISWAYFSTHSLLHHHPKTSYIALFTMIARTATLFLTLALALAITGSMTSALPPLEPLAFA